MNSFAESHFITQKEYFESGKTLNISHRITLLKKLRKVIIEKEDAICEALYSDFRKSKFESLLSETQFVLAELNMVIKKTRSWAKTQRIWPSLANFPSLASVYKEPYGQVLIISPWNYPFQLAIAPLIGAIAAGNTVILKPSEHTRATSAILKNILSEVFDAGHVQVIEGDEETGKALLQLPWNYIFFTGSVGVGRKVYEAAARNLTPVTLELGGKNPCVIDKTANIALTARRITWGKFLNGGQTCIAPDYILIHASQKKNFYEAMKNEIERAYGSDPSISPDYPRIINTKNFDRLTGLLEGQKIVLGGTTRSSDRFISPTLIDEPDKDSSLMASEIFGPILPVISFTKEEEIEEMVKRYPKPLAMYVFSSNHKKARKWMRHFSFGGGAINDTIIQIINKKLPFGGVGQSGIGSYHGRTSFDTFTHKKPVVRRGIWPDIPIRYAPYSKKLKIAKKVKHLI
ncbi:aldehyde dehydrogenase [Ascidiimonas aurantiaca]|uniref:aldehyde dehydrogenase n=1 Tax=Ascidiimonas aurantiaca TaxID=1685432 RepID=UPI0030EBC12C